MKPTEFLNELSNEKLAKYKTAASADATKADSEGDTEKANKRFSGIVKATKKQFANDEKQSVTEVANLSMDASQALQKLKQIAEMRSKFTYYGLQEAGHADIVLNAIKACSVFIDHFKNNKQLDYVQILKKLQTEIIAFKNADAFTTLGQLLQGTLGKINFQQGVAEAGNNYHANRTGFSRPSNHRDDERHDLDTPTQVWGLKINGKVWSKGGKDVTFTSKEAALNIRNSILKNRPDLEIGLVTKGGVSEELDENLHKWFKEKWVRFGPDGKIRGDCARGDDSEGKPKCLPQSKAHSLGKKGRASAASRKRREDPNPERSGKAINVNTKKNNNESVVLGRDEGNFVGDTPVNLGGVVVKNLGIGDIVSYFGQKAKIVAMSKTGNTSRITIPSGMGGVTKDVLTKDLKRTSLSEEELDEACWKGYHKEGNKKMFGKTYPNCVKNTNEDQEHHSESCPHCGGEMVSEELMNEKKDACYYKVKSRYKVWPSAYASGALVKCRKKGASNWGNGGKSNESVAEDDAGDVEQRMIAKIAKYKERLAHLKKTDPEAYKREIAKSKTSGKVPPVSTFEDQGVAEDQLDEKWTKKYKDSINCSNPKGFSQKAHCAGKQKNESAIMSGLNQLDEGWKEKLGAAALAGSMALGAGAAHSRVTPDGQGGFTGGLKPTATVTAPSDNKPAAEAPKGFSKEYLQKAADPNRTGRYMISVERAQELLKSMP